MQGFIFGRSTVQIMSGIQAAANAIGILVGLLDPSLLGPVLLTVNVIGGTLAVWVGILANNGTTPVFDPVLPSGTVVKVTNAAGDIVKNQTVTAPLSAKPLNGNGDGVA